MLQDILQARPLLWMLVKRELRSRYAGSNFGALWNLIHPVVLIAIYVMVFSAIMNAKMGSGVGRLSYAIHLCSAIIPWFLFSEIIGRCSTVLIENSDLLKKMAVPEEVMFLSVFITSLVVHGVSMLALIGFLLVMGAPLSWVVIFAFPVMVVLGISALGMGMILSVMTLLVRDVGQFVQIFLQLLFWSMPIVYLPSIIPPGKIQFVMGLNPLRGFFTLTQLLFGAHEADFNHDMYWVMVILPFAVLVMGMAFLRANRSEILDAL
jgi:homopolymeric O-antigen transport system permease protein